MDITRIQMAFSPANAITDPELFVGRRDEVLNGMRALTNPGSFLAIYGLRGVGKTSMAQQLQLIAEGHETLPQVLHLEKYAPRRGFRFLTQYIRCDTSLQTTNDLLRRMMFGEDIGSSLFGFTKSGDRRLDSIKKVVQAEGSAEISAPIFGARIGGGGGREEMYKTYVSDSLVQQFKKLLSMVRKDNQGRDGLLLIIDEFDIFPDKAGFASIVKTATSDFVKFAVVGIASSVTELLKGHASIGRSIEAIKIGRMTPFELIDILNNAEYRVGQGVLFTEPAKNFIINLAEGFPYFVHLVGREAMILAFERNVDLVDVKLIEEVNERITGGRLPTIYEDVYYGVVRHSPEREVLLKLLAETPENEIFIDDVCKTAQDMGIPNPYDLIGELTSVSLDDPVLVKVRGRYIHFSDPVFKVYARLRNWEL